MIRFGFLILITLGVFRETARAADWVRPGVNTNQPVWGVRGGLLWAVSPGGFRPRGEPRGLIRLGYPILTNGEYDLVNFIAVEPIVKGRKGFSELEQSALDNRRGKRLWAVSEKKDETGLVPGKLSTLPSGVEQLEVPVLVESFENGAKVRLIRAICSAVKVPPQPARGKSPSTSATASRNAAGFSRHSTRTNWSNAVFQRRRQMPTPCRSHPRRSAIASFLRPPNASRMISARWASPCGHERDQTIACRTSC